MPWTGKSFAAKHNHKLKGARADKAARIATAMVERGVDEGQAIATGNARAEGKPRSRPQSFGARRRTGKTKVRVGP